MSTPLDEETWVNDGLVFSRMDHHIQWWIGDWLLWGEANFGDRSYQAMEATGYKLRTLQNCTWVASRIEPSRRRADSGLKWSHFAEVAAQEPDAQDIWLERAEAFQWSVRELRQHMSGAGLSMTPLPEEIKQITADIEALNPQAWVDQLGDAHKRDRLEAALQATFELDRQTAQVRHIIGQTLLPMGWAADNRPEEAPHG